MKRKNNCWVLCWALNNKYEVFTRLAEVWGALECSWGKCQQTNGLPENRGGQSEMSSCTGFFSYHANFNDLSFFTRSLSFPEWWKLCDVIRGKWAGNASQRSWREFSNESIYPKLRCLPQKYAPPGAFTCDLQISRAALAHSADAFNLLLSSQPGRHGSWSMTGKLCPSEAAFSQADSLFLFCIFGGPFSPPNSRRTESEARVASFSAEWSRVKHPAFLTQPWKIMFFTNNTKLLFTHPNSPLFTSIRTWLFLPLIFPITVTFRCFSFFSISSTQKEMGRVKNWKRWK